MHKYVRKCPHAVSVFLAVFAHTVYMLMQSFSCIESDIKWPTTTLSFGALQNPRISANPYTQARWQRMQSRLTHGAKELSKVRNFRKL